MVLGSAKFVEEQLKAASESRKRPGKPHEMEGADWGGLTVGKGLGKNLFR